MVIKPLDLDPDTVFATLVIIKYSNCMKISLQARLEFLTGPLELTTVKTALEKLGYIVDYASVDYLPLITGMRSSPSVLFVNIDNSSSVFRQYLRCRTVSINFWAVRISLLNYLKGSGSRISYL